MKRMCFSRKKIFTSMNQSELLSSNCFSSIEFTTNNIHDRVSSRRKEGVDFVERTAPRCGVLVYVQKKQLSAPVGAAGRQRAHILSQTYDPDFYIPPHCYCYATALSQQFTKRSKHCLALSAKTTEYGGKRPWLDECSCGCWGTSPLFGSTATHSSSDSSIVFAHFWCQPLISLQSSKSLRRDKKIKIITCHDRMFMILFLKHNDNLSLNSESIMITYMDIFCHFNPTEQIK